MAGEPTGMQFFGIDLDTMSRDELMEVVVFMAQDIRRREQDKGYKVSGELRDPDLEIFLKKEKNVDA